MNYKVKTALVMVFLLSVTAYFGLILTQVQLKDIISGNNGLTGGAVAEPCQGEACPQPMPGCSEDESGHACRVACYSDDDCDDTLPQTEDICRNPGTEYSVCVNRPLRE